jgi:hypothetical protein
MYRIKPSVLLYIALAAVITLTGCQGAVHTSPEISNLQVTETSHLEERSIMTPTPTFDEYPSTNQADADVIFVKAVEGDGSWTFTVTVTHPDTGWQDYCDGWDVLTSDGTVLKVDPLDTFTRPLLHPHENEQPFTRNQSGIIIPEGITQLRVRAHDLIHGFGGEEITINLDHESGQGFEIIN